MDAHQIRHGDYEKQRIHKELHRGGMVLPVVVDAIDAIAAIGSGGGALLFDANKKKWDYVVVFLEKRSFFHENTCFRVYNKI